MCSLLQNLLHPFVMQKTWHAIQKYTTTAHRRNANAEPIYAKNIKKLPFPLSHCHFPCPWSILYILEIRSHLKMFFCSSCDSVPLKCNQAEWLGKYLQNRRVKCCPPLPPRTWKKETLSAHTTAFLGRNRG